MDGPPAVAAVAEPIAAEPPAAEPASAAEPTAAASATPAGVQQLSESNDDEGGAALPPIIRAPGDILAGVARQPESEPYDQPAFGDMMRGGFSAFRARSKQLSATLEATVADTVAQLNTTPPMPPAAEPEPEPEPEVDLEPEVAEKPVSPPPGPTAFGLRKEGNRADPWCLAAIASESYGVAEEDEAEPDGDGAAAAAAAADGTGQAVGVVDTHGWRGVIWRDDAAENRARLATPSGREALLRCLRAAATAQPEATPLPPEVWWRLGDLLSIGLSAATDSGEMVRFRTTPTARQQLLPGHPSLAQTVLTDSRWIVRATRTSLWIYCGHRARSIATTPVTPPITHRSRPLPPPP